MTPNTKAALVRKIQTGKRWLETHCEGFDDHAYRQLLRDYGGVEGEMPSSTDPRCDLVNVAERMHDLGFPRTRPLRAGEKPQGAVSKQGLLGKIDAYLAEAKLPTAYAVGIARRMYKIERLEWLTIAQLRGVVTALEKAERKAGRSVA